MNPIDQFKESLWTRLEAFFAKNPRYRGDETIEINFHEMDAHAKHEIAKKILEEGYWVAADEIDELNADHIRDCRANAYDYLVSDFMESIDDEIIDLAETHEFDYDNLKEDIRQSLDDEDSRYEIEGDLVDIEIKMNGHVDISVPLPTHFIAVEIWNAGLAEQEGFLLGAIDTDNLIALSKKFGIDLAWVESRLCALAQSMRDGLKNEEDEDYLEEGRNCVVHMTEAASAILRFRSDPLNLASWPETGVIANTDFEMLLNWSHQEDLIYFDVRIDADDLVRIGQRKDQFDDSRFWLNELISDPSTFYTWHDAISVHGKIRFSVWHLLENGIFESGDAYEKGGSTVIQGYRMEDAFLKLAIQERSLSYKDGSKKMPADQILAAGQTLPASRLFDLYSLASAIKTSESIPEHGKLVAGLKQAVFGKLAAPASVPLEAVAQTHQLAKRLAEGPEVFGKPADFFTFSACKNKVLFPRHQTTDVEAILSAVDAGAGMVHPQYPCGSLLEYAVDHQDHALAHALIDRGFVAKYPDEAGMALSAAAKFRDLKMLNTLIRAGAPLNMTDREDAQTAIHHAIKWVDPEMVQKLTQAGANLRDIAVVDFAKSDAFQILAMIARNKLIPQKEKDAFLSVANHLMDAGLDPDVSNMGPTAAELLEQDEAKGFAAEVRRMKLDRAIQSMPSAQPRGRRQAQL